MNTHLRQLFVAPYYMAGLACFILFGSCREQEERFYSIEDFSKVPKVDVHVHINTADPSLVEQAEKDSFFLLTINVDVPDYPSIAQQMHYAEELRRYHPERLYFLSTFETADIQATQWQEAAVTSLETAKEKGSVGVKVWKNIGMVLQNDQGQFIQIDDPIFDEVFGFLEKNKIPVCGHIGEPRNCWLPLEQMTVNNDRNYYERHPQYHMYQHPEYPSHDQLIGARDRLLEKYPNLKFIGTHLGSMEWDVDEIAKRLDKYPNMAVDLTARISHLQHQSLTDWAKVREFVIRYQDRIMYGTDLHVTQEQDPSLVKDNAHQTWSTDWQYLVTQDSMQNNLVNGKFKGLGLPQAVVDKIYFSNANEWYSLGLKP